MRARLAGLRINPSLTMQITAFLKLRRERYLDSHYDMTDRRINEFSGTNYSLWTTVNSVSDYCLGRVLDAGAGRGAWRSALLRTAASYESVDIAARGGFEPTWQADICAMSVVPSERFDCVVCHQVLEHVRHPGAALSEMSRVLVPGGFVVLSVPHLSRRHELPHDYFRFTQEGVRVLLEEAGLEVIRIERYGGLFTFLHHQISLLFPGMILGLPLLGRLALLLNGFFSRLSAFVDRQVDRSGLFANGVVAVARKAPV